MVSFDNVIHVESAKISSKFNFGRVLGYSYKKWSKLINNYVNFDYLDLVASEVRLRETKRSNSYNYTYHFDNSHGSGKDCLISLTFQRRKNYDKPIVIFNTRASEVTKRLIFDFLLIQRICEYVYGKEVQVNCVCYIPFMFINLECSMMYVADQGLDRTVLPDKKGEYSVYQKRLREKFVKFQNIDVETVKYKVHQRAAKQVQRDKDGNPISGVKDLLAKELKLTPTKKIRETEIAKLDEQVNS
jgi:hypothetical protein